MKLMRIGYIGVSKKDRRILEEAPERERLVAMSLRELVLSSTWRACG
jgi:hypothetical protein